MEFNCGDYVTGNGIQAGKYLGTDKIQEQIFYKILDRKKDMTYYIPEDKAKNLCKLPSKEDIFKILKKHPTEKLIDSQLLEGSRYKYFKNKMESGTLEDSLEVFHDLTIISRQKQIAPAERKILVILREKIETNLSSIFECDEATIQNLLTNYA